MLGKQLQVFCTYSVAREGELRLFRQWLVCQRLSRFTNVLSHFTNVLQVNLPMLDIQY